DAEGAAGRSFHGPIVGRRPRQASDDRLRIGYHRRPMATVTFLGACGMVTGSATLLAWKGARVLVDCGLFQGPEEIDRLNWTPFPFDAAELSAVVVTHAHLDHTGRLPVLARDGFSGPVWSTRPTRGLARLVLEDAGGLQEEEARYAAKKGYSRHPSPRPLFTRQDARRALGLFRPVDFDRPQEILPGITVTFRRAGHLLGAASLEITAKGADGERRTWGFSGDVGRYGVPILHDPEPLEAPLAALVLESTYGDRRHPPDDTRQALRQVIEATFARDGTVMIPSFALGRTQEVLYHLAALVEEGALAAADVFLDSPMAIRATELYRSAGSEHDEEMADLVDQELDPLDPGLFRFCRTVDQSMALNDRREPAVIVAGSGMVQGGRILHHLKRRLDDPRHAVCFVGYQAAGTRGRAILDGADVVVLHGQEVEVRASIHDLETLSAHADRDELLRWGRSLAAPPGRVFLNHGEEPARKALEAALAHTPEWPRPRLPLIGDRVDW
ncbi:MAG TPA: MBL fold metallo-hydrolase, partial [Thermoanaerobaculia bacterium]|nr:MBL fold metallo-hydrolase [Thermoanaerobaculia bacterium]